MGLGLAAVAVDFTTDVCVGVAVVATTVDSGLTSKDLSTILTWNCLFMGVLILFFFMSAAFLGNGVFCSGVDFPSQ